VLKETMMANERCWKGPGMVVLTSTSEYRNGFYLLKDQRNSLTLEWTSHHIGRWGGSSRVNEGMGVNRPSVKALRPNHGRGNSRHTQSCREKGKRGTMVKGRERESAHDRDHGRELEKLWKHEGVLNIAGE
jgi:hypothetical protein